MDDRKRQRRQTAGSLVSGLLFNKGTSKKKSTAQPRPVIHVLPRGIGPVYEPNRNDVLCGRGGRINAHVGNVQFRDFIQARKPEYLHKETKKLEKGHIAAEIVQQIRTLDPPGRFLKEDNDGSWWDIGDAKAIKKVGQALREDAPEIRPRIDHTEDAPQEEDEDSGKKKKEEPKASAVTPSPATKAAPSTPTVVSGRGGKVTTTTTTSPSRQQQPQSYQPLAYEPIVPPQQQQRPFQNIGMRGMVPKEAYSGPAAAAMKQHPDDDDGFQEPLPMDTAFGRQFHPPEILTSSGGTDSLISGLSNPTVLSGVSDPMSSVSLDSVVKRPSPQHQYHFLRHSQLQHLRNQWTAQHGSSGATQSPMTASAGLGSSLMRSYSGNLDWSGRGTEDISMSWADHSLIGGGIRESSLEQQQQQHQSSDCDGDEHRQQQYHSNNSDRTTSTRSTTRPIKTSDHHRDRTSSNMSSELSPRDRTISHDTTTRDRTISNMSASIASMSINSGGSLPSFPGSILSDMSESIVALDLAEPKLLDQFGEL